MLSVRPIPLKSSATSSLSSSPSPALHGHLARHRSAALLQNEPGLLMVGVPSADDLGESSGFRGEVFHVPLDDIAAVGQGRPGSTHSARVERGSPTARPGVSSGDEAAASTENPLAAEESPV